MQSYQFLILLLGHDQLWQHHYIFDYHTGGGTARHTVYVVNASCLGGLHASEVELDDFQQAAQLIAYALAPDQIRESAEVNSV